MEIVRLVIKTFGKSRDQDQYVVHQVSRPIPRPWSPGLETNTKTLVTRSRDQYQDLGHQVSRPIPRPWSPALETNTKVLSLGFESRSRPPLSFDITRPCDRTKKD